MNIEDLREFCLSLKDVTEGFPFDETTLVFKIHKIFCFTSLEGDLRITIKNDPEKIIQMREEYSSVIPGYHTNKTYWNTVYIDGSIPTELLKEWIVESYNLIVASLPKKIQQELKEL
ncbi:MAG: MmcQ/YjbR family DNA-binding protein [Prolixibacteraceae bacterium]|nr:MmcQ/YjbR family DNA-binding protein [Prolixibacteraceae bacterium]MBN2775608.1 MmcQ/YjbR family DNA-binding protein [Prolixibacteraceae bacterium]